MRYGVILQGMQAKLAILAGVLVVALGGWYGYARWSASDAVGRYVYTGTAEIEPAALDDIVAKLRAARCYTTGEIGNKCMYTLDKATGTLQVERPGFWGPSGYVLTGTTVTATLDLTGPKGAATFEAGLGKEIAELGGAVTLKAGSAKVKGAKDPRGAVY